MGKLIKISIQITFSLFQHRLGSLWIEYKINSTYNFLYWIHLYSSCYFLSRISMSILLFNQAKHPLLPQILAEPSSVQRDFSKERQKKHLLSSKNHSQHVFLYHFSSEVNDSTVLLNKLLQLFFISSLSISVIFKTFSTSSLSSRHVLSPSIIFHSSPNSLLTQLLLIIIETFHASVLLQLQSDLTCPPCDYYCSKKVFQIKYIEFF